MNSKKRANGEGTIYHRSDGYWQAQFLLNGKRHSYTSKTKIECIAWIDKMKSERDNLIDDTLKPLDIMSVRLAIVMEENRELKLFLSKFPSISTHCIHCHESIDEFMGQKIKPLSLKERLESKKGKNKSKFLRKLRYIKKSDRFAIFKRDGYKCVICGRNKDDGVKLEVDHIIPIAKGGESKFDNLRILCSDCNHGKSASLA